MRSFIASLIVLLCNSSMMAQEPSAVSRYLQFLDSQVSNRDLKDKIATSSVVELKSLARIIYEATESDPIGLKKSIGEMQRAHDSTYAKMKSTGESRNKVGDVERMYLNRIDTVLSKKVYTLASIPYILRVVIDSMTQIQYKSSLMMRTAPRTIVHATVLEVFKGEKRFSPHDSVEFYFMNGWIKTATYFRERDTCLVALETRTNPDGKDVIAIVAYLDRGRGYYVMCDNILRDPYNTFGYGTEIPWNAFRDSLLTQMSRIKSW